MFFLFGGAESGAWVGARQVEERKLNEQADYESKDLDWRVRTPLCMRVE